METKCHQNAILTGCVDSFCLVCESLLKVEDISAHIDKPIHQQNLESAPYVERYKDDRVRKVKRGYYCEFCNILITISTKVNLHLNEETHNDNKNVHLLKRAGNSVILSNEVFVNENTWNGLIEDTCALCNIEFVDDKIHKTEQKHILNLIQKSLFFVESDKSAYRMVDDDSFQCLTCNMIFAANTIDTHCDDENHKLLLQKCKDFQIPNAKFNEKFSEQGNKKVVKNVSEKENKKPNENLKPDENATCKGNNAKQAVNKDSKKADPNNVSGKENKKPSENVKPKENSACSGNNDKPAEKKETNTKPAENKDSTKPAENKDSKKPDPKPKTAKQNEQKYESKTDVNMRLKMEEAMRTVFFNQAKEQSCSCNEEELTDEEEYTDVEEFTDEEDEACNSQVNLSEFPKDLVPYGPPRTDTDSSTVDSPKSDDSPRMDINDPAEFAAEHKLTYNKGNNNAFCRICNTKLPASLKSMKEHVSGANHKSKSAKAKTKPPSVNIPRRPMHKFVKQRSTVMNQNVDDILLNDKLCLTRYSYLMITVHPDRLRCQACEVNLNEYEIGQHLDTASHEAAMEDTPVVWNLDGEFVREVRPGVFHCGFCNLVLGAYTNVTSHLQSGHHVHNRHMAGQRLGEHLPGILQHRAAREDAFYRFMMGGMNMF